MERIIDAFAWPVRDPSWLSKVLVMGLTLLIPIAGGINALGWMLASLDRLRAGDRTLPPAGLNYMGRGWRLFVVELVYAAAVFLLAAVLYIPSVAVLAREGQGSADPLLVTLGFTLSGLTFSVATLGSLLINFVTPSIVLAVERGGVGGGLAFARVLRQARGSLTNTLIAGLMLIAAGFIGSLGIALCVLGVLFTTAYSLAMQAWIIRSFELGSGVNTVA